MEELISIIVPVYNVESYIERCLISLTNQTYKNIEIILINDGSKDHSGEICDKWSKNDSRIVVFHKFNGGVSSARNLGLQYAKGKWISFVDPDDYMATNALEMLIKTANNQKADIVDCNYYKVLQGKNIEYPINKINEKINSTKYIKNILTYTSQVSLIPKIIRTELFNGLKLNESLSIGEDLIFNLNILLHNSQVKIFRLKDFLYFYLIRDDSAMRSSDFEMKYNNLSNAAIHLFQETNQFENYKIELFSFELINLYFRMIKTGNILTKSEYIILKNKLIYIPIFQNGLAFKFKILLWCYLTNRVLGNFIIKLRTSFIKVY